jgi:hypothetical protein
MTPGKEHALSTTGRKPCRICQTGQRISTATFAFFAVALFLASVEPDQSALRQALLAVCAVLSGVAVFRFPIARLVAGRLTSRGRGRAQPNQHMRNLIP